MDRIFVVINQSQQNQHPHLGWVMCTNNQRGLFGLISKGLNHEQGLHQWSVSDWWSSFLMILRHCRKHYRNTCDNSFGKAIITLHHKELLANILIVIIIFHIQSMQQWYRNFNEANFVSCNDFNTAILTRAVVGEQKECLTKKILFYSYVQREWNDKPFSSIDAM